MNKLTIPTILVATVMVAGIFAFIPVEKATTVHTTAIIPFLQPQLFIDVETILNTGDVFTLDCDAAYTVAGITAEILGTVGDEDLTVAIGGMDIIEPVAYGAAGGQLLTTGSHGSAAVDDTTITAGTMTTTGNEVTEVAVTVITSGACTFVSDDD